MATSISANPAGVTPNLGATTVADGASPIYTSDSTPPPNLSNPASIPTGSGSGLDADTIVGIQAVTAKVAGPNKLVATGSNGYLPLSIMPTGTAVSGIPSYVTGTYATIKATNPLAITFGIASTPGAGYTLMFYCGVSTVGDNGWIILGGS